MAPPDPSTTTNLDLNTWGETRPVEQTAVAQGMWFDGESMAEVNEITQINAEHYLAVDEGLEAMGVCPSSGKSCWWKTEYGHRIDFLLMKGHIRDLHVPATPGCVWQVTGKGLLTWGTVDALTWWLSEALPSNS